MCSESITIKMGIPQEPVLSATLLLVFINNDLLKLPFHGCVSAFTDDVTLF